MADLIAIAYPDETTAVEAADEARRLAKEGEQELQEALHGGSAS
jgi:uncharacterized membrane protein